MKKLLLIGLLFIAITGCKKEGTNKTTSQIEVIYDFYPNGEPSTIVYTSIKDGKTITLNNVTTPLKGPNLYHSYKISDYVKPGDHIKLEMSCSKQVNGYKIYVNHVRDGGNGHTYESPLTGKATIVNTSGTYKAVLEKTFTEADFK